MGMPPCFRVQKQTHFKAVLTKRPLNNPVLLLFESGKKNAFHTSFLSLLSEPLPHLHLSLSLIPISAFWFTDFLQELSFGECLGSQAFFTESPFWITFFFFLLDEFLNILASLSGREVKNRHAYQNVSLEWTQNNKQGMFSRKEVINFYEAGGQ